VIASGNHLLTQVKDNQPGLRRRLELGCAGRKPSGYAKSQTKGRNRWETRELTVFPAKAWFRHTPWERLIKTVLRLERTVCRRDPATGLCKQTTEIVFWVSSAAGSPPESWNEWIRGHWRIENGSHCVRDVAFAEDASRIRKNSDIVARMRSFAHNLLRASGCDNIKNARWRAGSAKSSATRTPDRFLIPPRERASWRGAKRRSDPGAACAIYLAAGKCNETTEGAVMVQWVASLRSR